MSCKSGSVTFKRLLLVSHFPRFVTLFKFLKYTVPQERPRGGRPLTFRARSHPADNPGANLKSNFHRCYLISVAFVWELTKETIHLLLGCLQGGSQSPLNARSFPMQDGCWTPLKTEGTRVWDAQFLAPAI